MSERPTTTSPHMPRAEAGEQVVTTPGAKWRVEGKPDPHGDHYDCERAKLGLGNMTDDELANAVFMHGGDRPDLAAIQRGEPSPISLLMAAKDRIRWLSRQLEGTTADRDRLAREVERLSPVAEAAREWTVDRSVSGLIEKALFVAVFDAFPGDFPGCEACPCGESDTCEDCIPLSVIRGRIEKWRAEAAQIAAASLTNPGSAPDAGAASGGVRP